MKLINMLIILFFLSAFFACEEEGYYNLDNEYLLTCDKGGQSYNEKGISLDLTECKWHLGIDGEFYLALSGSSNGDSIHLDTYSNGFNYDTTLVSNLDEINYFKDITDGPTYPESEEKEFNILSITVYKNNDFLEVTDTCRFR